MSSSGPHRLPGIRAFWTLWFVIGAVLGGLATEIVVWGTHGAVADGLAAGVLGTFAVWALVVGWRGMRGGVWVDADGVTVVNLSRTYRYDIKDVAGFDAPGDAGVHLVLRRYGRRVPLSAFSDQGITLPGPARKRLDRHRAAATALNARLVAARRARRPADNASAAVDHRPAAAA